MIHHKRLRPESAGAGRQHGGCGPETVIEREVDGVAAVFVTERIRFGAPGLFGGGAGAPGAVLIDGAPVDTRQLQVLHRGSSVTISTPGGGGYGNPRRSG